MKCLYTSDLHGLSLTTAASPEIIMIGGDSLPSFPPTKRYEDMVPNQKTFVDQFLLPLFNRILETTPVQQIFLIPGNWDLGYSYLFKDPMGRIIDLNQIGYRLKNGYELIGYPFVPPTPFRPKDYEKMDDREASWPPQKNPSYIRSSDQTNRLIPIDPFLYLRGRETIEEDLDRLPKPLHPKRTVYIMHSPPFGTRLDLTQGGKSAGGRGKSAGSRSIKTFIEKTQPLLTLHGHIHESPQLSGAYLDKIGETLSINPGQFSSTKLQAVLFELGNVEGTIEHTCLPKRF